ncbi:hypothetical protein ACQ4LE_004434 [Meloidogyne hapla]
MNIIIKCIFLYFTFSSTIQSGNDFTAEYIDEAAAAIAMVSSGTADVLLSLSNLGLHSALFLKVIVPVGSAIIANLNPESTSPVYKELMELKKRTDFIWLSNERAIQTTAQEIGVKIITEQYISKVIHPIAVMKNYTNKVTDPSFFKSETFIESYKRACEFGDRAPEEILTYLILRLVKNCKKSMSSEEVQSLVYHREYLLEAMTRFNVSGEEEIPDVGNYLREYLTIYNLLKNKRVLNMENLNVFNEAFYSYSEAFNFFINEIKIRGQIEDIDLQNELFDICFLRGLTTGVNFNYQQIEAFALELRDQLIDLAYIAGICANIIYPKGGQAMDNYIKLISNDIKHIANNTATYLKNTTIMAWPKIHHQILNEQFKRIVQKAEQITNDKLKIIIELTLPKLAETGEKNYQYQALIAKSDDEQQFHFDGIKKYCTARKNSLGYTAIINRKQINNSNITEKEKTMEKIMYLKYYGLALNNTIQREMKSIYNVANLTSLADILKNKMGKFIGEGYFKCWNILRVYAPHFWSSCPQIVYAKSSYGYGDLKALQDFDYGTKGTLFQVCEHYLFHLFM